MRLARAALVALGAAALSGCGGVECEPEVVAQRLAGPGARSCGVSDPYGDPAAPYGIDDRASLLARRDCVLRSVAEGRAFFASVTPYGSADGAVVRAWASDGARVYKITHRYACGPTGCTESQSYRRCARLGAGDPGCDSLSDDLCLTCEEPAAAVAACH